MSCREKIATARVIGSVVSRTSRNTSERRVGETPAREDSRRLTRGIRGTAIALVRERKIV